MKTGKEVLNRALELLGYTNNIGNVDGSQDAELFKRGKAVVSQIYDDLKRIDKAADKTVSYADMNASIPLSPEAVDDIMPYGVAMMIADLDNNGVAQAKFADLYNQKRRSVPRNVLTITDVIPAGGY